MSQSEPYSGSPKMGIDVRRDVLERLEFAPQVPRDPALINPAHFNP